MTLDHTDPVAAGPCASLAEAVVHLRRPFTPALVRAKLQAQGADWAQAVFFVDARAVIDRLNLLLPGLWHADFDLVDHSPAPLEGADPAYVYRCRLTAAEAAYTDVGEGFDHKAARSDALKRAAVHLGVGHCLYRIAPIRMAAGPRRHQLRGQPGYYELDDANHRWLRGRYRAWLTRMGLAEYGLPLHHGHAARSVAPQLFPEPASTRPASRPRAARTGAELSRLVPLPAASPPDHAEPSQLAGDRAGDVPTPAPAAAARAPRAPLPAPAPPPAREAAAAPTPTTPGPPPSATPTTSAASPDQRAALAEVARRLGYGEPTLRALARCVHGRTLAELSERALQDLRAFLDSAAGGQVSNAELAARLEQGLKEAQTEPPRERLARWLLAREERAAAAAA